MVFPDVKVFVHAFRADDSHRAVSWLERIVHRNAQFGISPLAPSAAVHIATNRGSMIETTEHALGHSELCPTRTLLRDMACSRCKDKP